MQLEITPELESAIASQIGEAVKNAYYGKVSDAINKLLVDKLTNEKVIDRIVQGVFDQIVLSEREYIDHIGKEIKEALLKTVSTIANATLTEIEKKVKAYGFIKIAERY